jgi:hypothetical protein
MSFADSGFSMALFSAISRFVCLLRSSLVDSMYLRARESISQFIPAVISNTTRISGLTIVIVIAYTKNPRLFESNSTMYLGILTAGEWLL